MTSAGSHASVAGTSGMMMVPEEREQQQQNPKVNNNIELNTEMIFVVSISSILHLRQWKTGLCVIFYLT